MTKKLICIVGPTAVGKTAVGVQLAKKFNTVVLNADSRQFYQEMSIGTAKPTPEELDGVPHLMLDFLSIHQNYTVSQFETEAISVLEQQFLDKDVVILVGGSGLFVNALCFGLDEIPDIEENIRSKIRDDYQQYGLKYSVDYLQSLHPLACENLDLNNPHRVLRALEVLIQFNKRIQDFQTKSTKNRNFECVFIGLNIPREELYQKINSRVDLMMANGLLNEVKKLEEFRDLTALKTVGYQEFYTYGYEGDNLKTAIEHIKQASRRYAKRQITWFKKTPQITWFSPCDFNSIVNFATQNI
jgi:tRNA dimethylallyltransferase